MDFLSLNDDTLALILLNLQPADFYRTCRVHPRITRLCNNWYFQQQYEEEWHPEIIRKLNNEFKHHPGRAFYLAGRLNDINLVKYLMSRYLRSYYLCNIFEGAGYSGCRRFIQLLWNFVDDPKYMIEINNEIRDDLRGCIITGAANRGHWDLIEEYPTKEPIYYLEGLIKGNYVDRFIEYSNSCKTGYLSSMSVVLIEYAVENSDPTILWYLLQLSPDLADHAAIWSLREGKTVLYEKLEQSYILTPDSMYLDVALTHFHEGGSLSILDFVFSKLYRLPSYDEIVKSFDIISIDLLIERVPKSVAYAYLDEYLRALIWCNNYNLFIYFVGKLNIPSEALVSLLAFVQEYRRSVHIEKYLEDIRV